MDGSVCSKRVTISPAVGGGASLDTVTVIMSEAYWTPTLSVATAVRVCEPLSTVVVFQETEYGALVSSAPRLTPSTLNWTPTTPRESSPVTLALTGTVPVTVDPEAGEVIVTINLPGGGGSTGGGICAEAWGGIQGSMEIKIRAAA